MLNQTENRVHIEGILSEVDLSPKTFKKNGEDVSAIGGFIKVRVNQKVNGEDAELEIPVHMFATQYTNAGKPNPSYESIMRVMTEYVSIAAGGIDKADRVRINGSITMNEYYGQNGTLISFPRIKASFVEKPQKITPGATFDAVFVVGQKGYELDKDGVETNRYKITGILPQYGGKVDVVPFYGLSSKVINGISNTWNEGDTVKAKGVLNFTSRVETTEVESAFGEPITKTRTISVSELIITGGAAPMTGEFAIDMEEISQALADRKAALAVLKDKAAGAKAPAANSANKFKDLGF